jgi:hypothetical protein
MSKYRVVCARAEDAIPLVGKFHTVFADPPDGIRLGYDVFKDRWADDPAYIQWLYGITVRLTGVAETVWLSYAEDSLLPFMEIKPFVQTFTFGQYRGGDCANNHRPLLRLRFEDSPLYPNRIKVPSWRELNGDKRAAKGGRVPGDVWDFPRVTGNSAQRRRWHPTQLHEGLVARALKFTTPRGGSVLDPFGGTGTTLRVAKALGFSCTLIELSENYCRRICAENKVPMYKIVGGRLRLCR